MLVSSKNIKTFEDSIWSSSCFACLFMNIFVLVFTSFINNIWFQWNPFWFNIQNLIYFNFKFNLHQKKNVWKVLRLKCFLIISFNEMLIHASMKYVFWLLLYSLWKLSKSSSYSLSVFFYVFVLKHSFVKHNWDFSLF